MNDRLDIVDGDVVGPRRADRRRSARSPTAATIASIDAGGGYLLPGFIQTHIHLCQTLFRGSADDMPLLEWLKRRVWPMEAAHTPATLRASVRLAAAELLLSGTTSVLTMETVHDTDVVFEALARDRAARRRRQVHDGRGARRAARGCRKQTRASIDESLALKKRWDGAANGRLRAAFAPRFAVSCSRELLEAVAALSEARAQRSSTRTRRSRATRSKSSAPVGRVLESRIPRRHRSRDARLVHRALRVGRRSASRHCSPNATSRSCTAPART